MDNKGKNDRQLQAQKRQWKKIEQAFRSRVSADLMKSGEEEGKKRWEKVKTEVATIKEKWGIETEEKLRWATAEVLAEAKVEVVMTYGKWWGKTGAESGKLTAELLYWHLTQEFSEAEKMTVIRGVSEDKEKPA